jgi:hypothetical protein
VKRSGRSRSGRKSGSDPTFANVESDPRCLLIEHRSKPARSCRSFANSSLRRRFDPMRSRLRGLVLSFRADATPLRGVIRNETISLPWAHSEAKRGICCCGFVGKPSPRPAMTFGNATVDPLTPTLCPVAGGDGVIATAMARGDRATIHPVSCVRGGVTIHPLSRVRGGATDHPLSRSRERVGVRVPASRRTPHATYR